MSDNLEKKIKDSLVEGKLPCAIAFKIAEELDVAPSSVKDATDKLSIKISACQLGCFP